MEENVKIESTFLPDGRKAERHTKLDAEGREVVEFFAEELRPLKLEKRIVKERKEIIAKQTTETLKDGQVIDTHILEVSEDPPLQAKVKDEYVKSEELKALVTDSVVAGLSALVETLQVQQVESPKIRMQEAVAQNVEQKKENNWNTIAWMAAILVVQLGLITYVIKFM